MRAWRNPIDCSSHDQRSRLALCLCIIVDNKCFKDTLKKVRRETTLEYTAFLSDLHLVVYLNRCYGWVNCSTHIIKIKINFIWITSCQSHIPNLESISVRISDQKSWKLILYTVNIKTITRVKLGQMWQKWISICIASRISNQYIKEGQRTVWWILNSIIIINSFWTYFQKKYVKHKSQKSVSWRTIERSNENWFWPKVSSCKTKWLSFVGGPRQNKTKLNKTKLQNNISKKDRKKSLQLSAQTYRLTERRRGNLLAI